jgi:mRNA interferase MazF
LLTSNKKLSRVPGNVLLEKGTANLPKTSVVVASQMATVDKMRLLEKIGTLGKEKVEEVLEGCRRVVSRSVY